MLLSAQVARREVERRYLALAWGQVKRDEGQITLPLGRHPRARQKMVVGAPRGREAVTEFKVLARLQRMTLLECRLITGRTHQIRVHLSSQGHPVVGDRAYGGMRPSERALLSPEVRACVESLESQALHAYRLEFVHPIRGTRLTFSSPPRADFGALLEALGWTTRLQ